MKLLLASPRGFCAGVIRAIHTVEEALKKWGAPIYVKHQIVHNRHVVKSLEDKGAIFIEDLKKVPISSVVIFSAHGVTPEVREEANTLQLKAIDATCPLVTKLHAAAIRYGKKGYHILLIGHKKHVEIQGIYQEMAEAISIIEKSEDIDALTIPKEKKKLYMTQTTLSIFDIEKIANRLKEKFPDIETLPTSSICYATTNRQKALSSVAKKCDVVFVVGDPKSSNSNRLKECAQRYDIPAYLINHPDEIDPSWLKGVTTIGMSAGASTPASLTDACIKKLESYGVKNVVEEAYCVEEMNFSLPEGLLI